MLTTAQLAARRRGIGGSDLAAVMGQSPYKTPFQVWQEKTGRLEDAITPEQAERMHWGNVLEDVVARHYAEQRGCSVQRINTMLVHPEWPCILANLDRVRVTEGSRARWSDNAGCVLGADGLLEVKTANAFAANDSDNWGEAGTDEVPQHYWLQVQHYLGVSGLPFGDLAVLFGGQKFRVYTITADVQLQADLFAQATDWWTRHVVADVPPDPTTEAEARVAWAAHRDGKAAIATQEVAQAVEALRCAKDDIDALEEHAQALRDLICTSIGDAEVLTWQGQKLATWKANKASQKTDWKGVCAELGAAQEIINRFTTTNAGARVLRLAKLKE
jgi:putative phage-type endonuclease